MQKDLIPFPSDRPVVLIETEILHQFRRGDKFSQGCESNCRPNILPPLKLDLGTPLMYIIAYHFTFSLKRSFFFFPSEIH